jgi:two-component system cell cycle sensor histidine kinase/response regulator CckA
VEQPSPRVLVVDDEEGIRNFAARALASEGYEVVVASDGPDALLLVEAQRLFDLFVIDVMMPRMRGDELGRRLHQRDPDTKVLYFTGYTEQLFAERPVLRENEAVVEKPVTVGEFQEAVSLLLFGHARGPAAGTSGLPA